jgi:Putative addiction module component
MNALPIKQMSLEQKLRAMEELWESLSELKDSFPSPSWHEDRLRETAKRYEAGQEQPIDWEAAKDELRKRAE